MEKKECPKCPAGQGDWKEGKYFDRCNNCRYEEDKRKSLFSFASSFNSNPKYFDIGLTYPEELGRSGYVMSPSIFPREKSYRGFKFFFHAGEVLEKYEPSHVHVEGHGYWMEIWVPSCQIKDKGNMAPSEVAGIKKFLKKNMDKVMDKWREYKKRGKGEK